MYKTTYTSFLHNSFTSYMQQVYDTVHKTSITLLTRPQPTCYTHQHAQRATITQFLRLHSTFSSRSLTCYVLFFWLILCPPCFATFHIPRTAKPRLLKRLKTQFICVYISSLLPKSIQRCQTFVETLTNSSSTIDVY
jgi:hypothetical protein